MPDHSGDEDVIGGSRAWAHARRRAPRKPLTWSGAGSGATRNGSMIVDRSTTNPSAPLAFHSATEPTASAFRTGSIAPS